MLQYHVDLIFCIDATESMTPVIEQAKGRALHFYHEVMKDLAAQAKNVAQSRIKVIVYRDFYHDGIANSIAPLSESPFFSLPDQNGQLESLFNGIHAMGGGDEPESGLEAIALALQSDWTREGDRQRHAIVLFTDASAHKLPGDSNRCQEELPSEYPKGLSANLDELTTLWHSRETGWVRLLLFAPDVYPWSHIAEHWERALLCSSQASDRLKESDLATMVAIITRKISNYDYY